MLLSEKVCECAIEILGIALVVCSLQVASGTFCKAWFCHGVYSSD